MAAGNWGAINVKRVAVVVCGVNSGYSWIQGSEYPQASRGGSETSYALLTNISSVVGNLRLKRILNSWRPKSNVWNLTL